MPDPRRDVRPDANGDYPVGTTVPFSASYRHQMVVSLVRRPDGWPVDLRWWLAMIEMASGPDVRSRRSFKNATTRTRTTSAVLRKAVSARMKRYWAERRKAQANVK